MNKTKELIKYVVLSIVQGVGEVLPISSSGHLVLVRKLLNINTAGVSVELILHLASLVALFVYYRKTIYTLTQGVVKYVFYKDIKHIRDYKFVRGMIISLMPTCIVGFLFDDYLDKFINYSFLIGVFLVLNGINLCLIKNENNIKKIEELSITSFVKIGIGQCMGLIPGFSRSGSALSMCYREKMDKEDGKKFTFLMLFPLVIGSIILNIDDFSFNKENAILISISFLLTIIITMFSINLFNKIVNNNKLHYFSYYCLIMGILVIFVG